MKGKGVRAVGVVAPLILVGLAGSEIPEDRTRARNAFMKAYPVFMHPRCQNCHPAGDTPLQGDDSHVHDLLRLRRGADGNGVFAMRCSNCHQAANGPGPHTPPGAPQPAAEGGAAGSAAMAPPPSEDADGLPGPDAGTALPSTQGSEAERRADAGALRPSRDHGSPRALGMEPRGGAHDPAAVARGVRRGGEGMARRGRRLSPLTADHAARTRDRSVKEREHGEDLIRPERSGHDGRGRSDDTLVVGSAGPPRADRDEIRMRHGGVRLLHGPSERRRRPLVRHPGGARERSEGDDRRGPVVGPQPCRSARLARGAGPAVRLLPVGTADVGGVSARDEAQADRRGYRRRHVRQSLPLRNVPTHPARHPSCGRDRERRSRRSEGRHRRSPGASSCRHRPPPAAGFC